MNIKRIKGMLVAMLSATGLPSDCRYLECSEREIPTQESLASKCAIPNGQLGPGL
jgi:hypothetical protein